MEKGEKGGEVSMTGYMRVGRVIALANGREVCVKKRKRRMI